MLHLGLITAELHWCFKWYEKWIVGPGGRGINAAGANKKINHKHSAWELWISAIEGIAFITAHQVFTPLVLWGILIMIKAKIPKNKEDIYWEYRIQSQQCLVKQLIVNSASVSVVCSKKKKKGCPLCSNLFQAVDVIFSNFLFGRGQLSIWFPLPSNLLIWQSADKLIPVCPCAFMYRKTKRDKASHIRQGVWTYRHRHKHTWVKTCRLT